MALNKAKIISHKMLTADVLELAFETESNFDFKPGQYTSFKVDDGKPGICFRPYSIASYPGEIAKGYKTTLKIVDHGRASNWLKSKKINDELEFLGPIGKFLFETTPGKIIYFVATGTGITPLRAMICELLQANYNYKLHLIFGVRYKKDIFYQDFFHDLSKKHQNFSFSMCVSQPEDSCPDCEPGRVTDCIEKLTLNQENSEVYICGLKAMIDSVKELFLKKGLPETAIHFEKYD